MAGNGRGKSPGSRKALDEHRNVYTSETALEASKKALKTKQEYKSFREGAKGGLTPEVMDRITAAIIEKALAGDVRAYEVLRDTMGEKPSDTVELAGGMALQVELTVVE